MQIIFLISICPDIADMSCVSVDGIYGIYIYITVIGLDNSNLTSTSFHNLLRYLISHVTQHQATRGQPKVVHAVLSPAPAKTVSDGKCSTCPA